VVGIARAWARSAASEGIVTSMNEQEIYPIHAAA
jgi:hypothetical protein